MSNSRTAVRCLIPAIAVCASLGSVARAQPLPHLRGEGTYSGDLSGPLTVNINDNYDRSGLWVEGVLYGGSNKYPATPGVIGFNQDFLAGGLTITNDPFEGGPFTAMRESSRGHIMRFEGTVENNVASGTWTLDYDEDSSDCENAAGSNRSCTTQQGTFEVNLVPVGAPNTVQPLDLTSLCGAIGPAMAGMSLLGMVAIAATRRHRSRARR